MSLAGRRAGQLARSGRTRPLAVSGIRLAVKIPYLLIWSDLTKEIEIHETHVRAAWSKVPCRPASAGPRPAGRLGGAGYRIAFAVGARLPGNAGPRARHLDQYAWRQGVDTRDSAPNCRLIARPRASRIGPQVSMTALRGYLRPLRHKKGVIRPAAPAAAMEIFGRRQRDGIPAIRLSLRQPRTRPRRAG